MAVPGREWRGGIMPCHGNGGNISRYFPSRVHPAANIIVMKQTRPSNFTNLKTISLKSLAVACLWVATIIPATAQSYTFTTLAGTAGIQGSADGSGAAARFNNPHGITTDDVGNLYVADTGNNIIRKIVISSGVVTTFAGTGGYSTNDGMGNVAQFNQPAGIMADGVGNLYVADTGNHTIRKIVISSGAVSTVAGSAGNPGNSDGTGTAAQFHFPEGIAADGPAHLYVADTWNHSIRQIVIGPGGVGEVTTLAGSNGISGTSDGVGSAARFNSPYGVAADGLGHLFVADEINDTIRMIVIASATVSTLAGSPQIGGSANGAGITARFNSPAGVTADVDGNVYVADQVNSTIRKIVTNMGTVTTVAGNPQQVGYTDGTGINAKFKNPYGIAAGGSTNLYVADTGNSTIRIGKVPFTLTASGATVDACGSTCPYSVTFSTDPDYSWTAVSDSIWIRVLDPSSGMGSGTVHYTNDPNLSPNSRTGTITIAGQTFTVTQPGLSYQFTLAKAAPSLPPIDAITLDCHGDGSGSRKSNCARKLLSVAGNHCQ